MRSAARGCRHHPSVAHRQGGKFGKTRLVPHGPRIAALLAAQIQRRRDDDAIDPQEPLFTFVGAPTVHPCTASQAFHRLVMALDLTVPDGVAPPTLHSLRHSFAVGCLLRWYRQGLDPASRLHQLSTFMGHADPAATQVYLTITSELLDEANRRFEALRRPSLDGDRAMTPRTPLGQLLHSFFQTT